MEPKEEVDNFYCECGSCGESGCCSPSMCFLHLIKNSNCKFGVVYVQEMNLAIEFSDFILDYVLEHGSITSKDAHRKYDELMEKHFHEQNLEEK